MHASASRLVLVLFLIGRKSGANLLGQSRSVVIAKPITLRHSNENRSIQRSNVKTEKVHQAKTNQSVRELWSQILRNYVFKNSLALVSHG